MTLLPSKGEMEKLLDAEISKLLPVEKAFIESKLIPIQKKNLKWEYGKGELFEAWLLADFKISNVGVLFCKGGFGELGLPWGLTFFDDNSFGHDSGWYENLQELIQDGWLE